MGFEPTTLGTTILYSNRLSYIHHLICFQIGVQIYTLFSSLQNFCRLFFKLLQKISKYCNLWLANYFIFTMGISAQCVVYRGERCSLEDMMLFIPSEANTTFFVSSLLFIESMACIRRSCCAWLLALNIE